MASQPHSARFLVNTRWRPDPSPVATEISTSPANDRLASYDVKILWALLSTYERPPPRIRKMPSETDSESDDESLDESPEMPPGIPPFPHSAPVWQPSQVPTSIPLIREVEEAVSENASSSDAPDVQPCPVTPSPPAWVPFTEPTPLELLIQLKQAKEVGESVHEVMHELQNKYYPLLPLPHMQSPRDALASVEQSYATMRDKLESLSEALDSGVFDGLDDEKLADHPILQGRETQSVPFEKEVPTTRSWLPGFWNHVKKSISGLSFPGVPGGLPPQVIGHASIEQTLCSRNERDNTHRNHELLRTSTMKTTLTMDYSAKSTRTPKTKSFEDRLYARLQGVFLRCDECLELHLDKKSGGRMHTWLKGCGIRFDSFEGSEDGFAQRDLTKREDTQRDALPLTPCLSLRISANHYIKLIRENTNVPRDDSA
ncbi:hypothetical protein EV361DRAFT_871878 [Lentinula raphanica]|nr:hypothetical protein F5880DRAFT_1508577 [Lentinula raphanica]KAJ3967116.1 hypothetical protein EV361DRAFT_871878 [Lentinula raphanica]